MDFRQQRHYRAPAGKPGGTNNRFGADGEDIVIRVPPGTMVFNANDGQLLADLVHPEERRAIARGGRGGRGNRHFASSVHRVPRIAERGQPGESYWARLELNLLADVGLVGFPNAGKSTVISRVSSARPRIADYPFTTLVPNLGVVADYGQSFVIADVPGLIEGAHEGAGLGHAFLRHLSRTRVLVHLVDMSPLSGRDPVGDYQVIEHELAAFSPELALRPRVVVANKMDLEGSTLRMQRLAEAISPTSLHQVSAATGEGLADVMWTLRKLLDLTPLPTISRPPAVVRPVMRGIEVVAEEATVRLLGDVEERAAMTFWGNPEAEEYFCEYLRRCGVPALLRRRQIADATEILIGEGKVLWKDGELTLSER